MAGYARRLDRIQPFHVMRLLHRARELEAQGRDIIHMEVGEPDFDTPEPIVRAGVEALREGRTHYTPAVGLPRLREAIAGYYASRFGVDVSPERIVVTPGASGALQLLMALLANPGDRVLMADPGYPCNRNFAFLYDARPVAVDVSRDGFQLTPELVEQHWGDADGAMALLTTPANPTGAVIGREALAAIREVARRRGGHLLVDEIYQGLTYDGEPFTAAELGEDVFVINSFSKFFGMTGWRLGWLVAPPDAVPELDKLAQNLFLAAPTPSQYAALAAFEPETLAILENRRQRFEQRRDSLMPALENLGFRFAGQPSGAFYLYADCRGLGMDSDALSEALLEQAGVATTPGRDFSVIDPGRWLRFAFTTRRERLEEGVARIAAFLGRVSHGMRGFSPGL